MSVPAMTLLQRRCVNHPQREASARCPECAKFFCRECITEHDDRVLCATCLAKLSVKKANVTHSWAWLPRTGLLLMAIVLIYLAIYLAGTNLIAIPSRFHAHGGW